ncbi:MAG: type II toxin-antitoxin system Phd/YefM family antitoxin [Oscillibacter sp.]|nr:type II toxin-antitoxin system Phd/YefM family antitoxin [Oscillibacter sp.]
MKVSTSELAADINRYVSLLGHGDILITRNEKLVARLTSADVSDEAEKAARISAAKALVGILPPDVDLERAREERLL